MTGRIWAPTTVYAYAVPFRGDHVTRHSTRHQMQSFPYKAHVLQELLYELWHPETQDSSLCDT